MPPAAETAPQPVCCVEMSECALTAVTEGGNTIADYAFKGLYLKGEGGRTPMRGWFQSKGWFFLRVFLIVASIVTGALRPFLEPAPLRSKWGPVFAFVMIAGAFFWPVCLLFVMGLQSINPWSSKKWTRPNWYCNFLNPRDPLPFFHFAAFFLGGAGIGELVSTAATLGTIDWEACMATIHSCEILLGVKICEVAFGARFN